MFLHILRRAWRSLRNDLYLNLVSTGVIASALLLVGVFMVAHFNLGRIVDTWDRDVHISAYFHNEINESGRFAARDRLAALPEVQEIRYVSEADARAWLTEQMSDMAEVLDEVGTDALPASLEITLRPGTAEHPSAIASFADGLAQGAEFDEVDYGQQWVERFNTFLSLMELLAAILGSLVVLAALFLVGNTVDLVVYNRRSQLEIEKLVGATTGFIVTPFVLEGLFQGIAGGTLAIGGLLAVHRMVTNRLQDALQLGLVGELQFLPTTHLLLMVLIGAIVGAVAAGFAVTRFVWRAP